MERDLFASLRKRDTGVSTSYLDASVTPQHDPIGPDTPQEPQESAPVTPQPPKHLPAAGREGSVDARQSTGVVPGIQPSDSAHLPAVWRDGLAKLNSMPPPGRTTTERWHELVLDTHRFAWIWLDVALTQGWSIGSLVGFDRRQPNGYCGAVLEICGGRCIDLTRDDRGRPFLAVATPSGGFRDIYRHMPDDARPIWDIAPGPFSR